MLINNICLKLSNLLFNVVEGVERKWQMHILCFVETMFFILGHASMYSGSCHINSLVNVHAFCDHVQYRGLSTIASHLIAVCRIDFTHCSCPCGPLVGHCTSSSSAYTLKIQIASLSSPFVLFLTFSPGSATFQLFVQLVTLHGFITHCVPW